MHFSNDVSLEWKSLFTDKIHSRGQKISGGAFFQYFILCQLIFFKVVTMGNDSSKSIPGHGKKKLSLSLKPGPSSSVVQRHLENARKSRVLQLKNTGLKQLPIQIKEVNHCLSYLYKCFFEKTLKKSPRSRLPFIKAQFFSRYCYCCCLYLSAQFITFHKLKSFCIFLNCGAHKVSHWRMLLEFISFDQTSVLVGYDMNLMWTDYILTVEILAKTK